MKKEWEIGKNQFLASNDKEFIEFNGQQITKKQFDKRTPGLFKPEFEGDGMVCLNSKVVHAWTQDETRVKTSCKGTNRRRNLFSKEHFLSVLQTQIPEMVVNAGFVKDHLSIKLVPECLLFNYQNNF